MWAFILQFRFIQCSIRAVTVRFMQSEYSVERGEESVVVMLVVSDYSGHIKSDHDWFTLKITYTEETAQGELVHCYGLHFGFPASVAVSRTGLGSSTGVEERYIQI